MATKQQVSDIFKKIEENQEFFEKLSTKDIEWVMANSEKTVDLIVKLIVKSSNKDDILSPVITTITIPPIAEEFIAKNKFKVNFLEKTAKIKISFVGKYFNCMFLDKIEGPLSSSNICSVKLKKDAADYKIIDKLNGEKSVEMTLAQIYFLLALQPNGEKGKLLINGMASLFYVRDIFDKIQPVSLRWNSIGWEIDASSIDSTNKWRSSNEVFYQPSI